LVEAIEERQRKPHTCSLASSVRGVAKYAGARHVREWSVKILILTLRACGFLLLLNIFACMEKIEVD
jgi:hypothetical protein